MSEIGAMIAAALLKEVVQQIGSLVGGQIKLQLNLDKDLKEMKATLESIEALLKDAEDANTNNSMSLWLSRLKDAMYDITDMIEDFDAGTEAEPTRETARSLYDNADVTAFTMHDLLHDLARSVMGDEFHLAGNDGDNGEKRCHYALLSDCSKPLGRIRAIRFMGSAGIRLDGAAFASAKSLRVLDLSECSIHELGDSIGQLKQLRYLNAPRILVIPDSITRLSKLLYLSLRESYLFALPESIGKMESLMYLDLSGCERIKELPESFGKLKKLVHLDLSKCSDLENILKFMWSFTGLQYLNLSSCYSIVSLPSCYRLREKPVPHPSTSFVSLPLFQVRVRDGESSSNLICLKDTNPPKLDIFWLENVKSADEAQNIKLMEKSNLKELWLSWSEGAERFVDDKVLLEKLMPPKSVHNLVIMGYNGTSLPTWVSQQNSSLTLTGMEHLEEMSVSDSSRMSGSWSINYCPKLRMWPLLPRAVYSLEIRGSDNVLSSWGECTISSTGASSSSSSSVLTPTRTLIVEYSELPMQQWRLLRHLSVLDHLEITTCPDLTISPDIIPHLSSVKRLVINRCNISSLPHWFMDLTGLEHLRISGCEGIRSLPEGIQQLTELEILQIDGCPDLRKWCESEENKMKLAHIENKRFY